MTVFRLLYILLGCSAIACSKKQAPVNALPDPAVIIRVSTADELRAALAQAKPGQTIQLADGIYKGKFVTAPGADGLPGKPIVLQGSSAAILDAESLQTGYVLYLQADHWIVRGMTITNGLKGIMADGIHHTLIDSVTLHHIGEEGIHIRKFSSHNTISHCNISYTGLKTPDYGEGIYIGSAKNNWPVYSDGLPDRCDSNEVTGNHVGPYITAECIDIKEGTTGGLITSNYFDATGITGANSGDSWIDVKGNNYRVQGNIGFNPGGGIFKDGYQVHVAVSGWGNYNEFANNQCEVNGAGYGFNIQLSGSNGTSTGNKVYTSNTVTGAASGASNIPQVN